MTNQSLRATIAKLADDFADQLFDAVRSMSLEELMDLGQLRARAAGMAGARDGRSAMKPQAAAPASGGTKRRSQEDIEAVADQIVQLLKSNKEGLRAENLRAELGLSREEIVRPIAYALETNRVTKRGEKRATTYFAR